MRWFGGEISGELLLLKVAWCVLDSNPAGMLWLFALAAFYQAAVFNGDLSTWDVSRATNLEFSECKGWVGMEHQCAWAGTRRDLPCSLSLANPFEDLFEL